MNEILETACSAGVKCVAGKSPGPHYRYSLGSKAPRIAFVCLTKNGSFGFTSSSYRDHAGATNVATVIEVTDDVVSAFVAAGRRDLVELCHTRFS